MSNYQDFFRKLRTIFIFVVPLALLFTPVVVWMTTLIFLIIFSLVVKGFSKNQQNEVMPVQSEPKKQESLIVDLFLWMVGLIVYVLGVFFLLNVGNLGEEFDLKTMMYLVVLTVIYMLGFFMYFKDRIKK